MDKLIRYLCAISGFSLLALVSGATYASTLPDLNITALAGVATAPSSGAGLGVEISYRLIPEIQLGAEYLYSTAKSSTFSGQVDYYFSAGYYAGALVGATIDSTSSTLGGLT